MTIEQLMNEFEADAKINSHTVAEHLLYNQQLHSKYYRHFIEAKARLAMCKEEKEHMYSILYRYYTGVLPLSDEEMNENNFEYGVAPARIPIGTVDIIISSDIRMKKVVAKLSVAQIKKETLYDFVAHLDKRVSALRGHTEALKWSAGG